MNTYLGISIIILTVTVCVHCVFEKAKKIGIVQGRHEILLENMIRAQVDPTRLDSLEDELHMMVENSDNYLEHHEEVKNLRKKKVSIH